MTLSENNRIGLASISLLVVSILGFFLIWQFAEKEKAKDLNAWEERLNLIAASRSDAVSAWLNRHLESLKTLSDDASLQIYTSEIATDPSTSEAQLSFVRNLLNTTAQNTGFHENRPMDQIQANVRASDRAGLALAFADGKVMIASSGMPQIAIPTDLMKIGQSFITMGPSLSDRTPLILFGAPVGTLEGFSTGNINRQAWVIGARAMDDDFLSLLSQPGVAHESGRTYLVQAVGDTDAVTILTPLTEGGRHPETLKNQAAAEAIKQPGKARILPGALGSDVMATGRDLSAPVDWVLVRSIAAKEALSTVNSRRNELITTLSIAALTLGIVIFLVWKLGVSHKLSAALTQSAHLSKENAQLNEFLVSVSNSQPTAIAAVDISLTIRHANNRMGEQIGANGHHLIERPLATAFLGEDSKRICAAAQQAVDGKANSFLHQLVTSNKTYQIDCIPLQDGNNPDAADARALIVMQDVSELIHAREEREAFFDELVSTLASIIDARDPWSKKHSAHLVQVANALTEAMKLDEVEAQTTLTAARLMNLGKILVPREILVKQTPLTKGELVLVRESILEGGAFLSDLSFGGPVADTIKQVQAHWDGTGLPSGLAGEDILIHARILSVANAFVALVSSRAHRDGMDFDRAVEILSKDSGAHYDKSVITALAYILDHGDGREKWAAFREQHSSNDD